MGSVELTPEAVLIRSRLGRARSIYYEELAAADAVAGALRLTLHDGRHLIARLPPGRAEALAEELGGIVGGVDAALAGITDLAGLRAALAHRVSRSGFTAAPLVDLLLRAAGALNASDLHLEPAPDGGHRVWLRLDGALHLAGVLPPGPGQRTAGRLKVIAGMRAHRRDIPQEGRARVPGGWVRLSCVPAVGGESLTVRLFDRLKGEATIDQLGFGPAPLSRLAELLAAPSGVLLLAGPSASGKTTTMYTLLRHLLREAGETLRAVTVEDPVEYRLDGVTQLEAEPARGNTGAALLRSVLRQDADVLVVGEVRDAETAELVLRAGLTGHRVLSTVHAGGAVEAVLRLFELGASSTVVASALVGVAAQRLVRCRCADCGGGGCVCCLGTGYRGRTAVAEVLPLDDAVRSALMAGPAALAGVSVSAPMAVEAARLVEAGVTDAAEVKRVFGEAGS